MIDKELFIKNTKAMLENDNCGLVSDGDHSFNDLYHHRAILTASLFNCNKDICWKSKLHDTGDMFDGYFIVGIIVDLISHNYKCRKCAYYNRCCNGECEQGIKEWLESEAE